CVLPTSPLFPYTTLFRSLLEELPVLLIEEEGTGDIIEDPVIHLAGGGIPAKDPPGPPRHLCRSCITVLFQSLDPLGVEEFRSGDTPQFLGKGPDCHPGSVPGIPIVCRDIFSGEGPGGCRHPPVGSKIATAAEEIILISHRLVEGNLDGG